MNSKTHLLIVSHACALPQNQLLFALAQAREDWKVTLLLPDRWKNEYGDFMDASLLNGFKAELATKPVFRNGSVPLHCYRTWASRLARKFRPDIIYSHNEPYALSTIQWCLAAKRLSIPFGFFSCQNLVKRYPTPFRQAEKWVYRNSQFAFPITQSVDEVHREKGYRGNSVIVPLGFDPQQYSAQEDVRQRHATHEGDVQLVFIGRVVEEKGLITLAKALAQISELPWHLTMIGAGPYEQNVRQALERQGLSGRVTWKGFIPHSEVATMYESMDCLLLPSETRSNWKEQFGRVLVESMACGTPVVGSDSGEIPTIIKKTGGGIAFRETNVDDCSNALRKMITDKEARTEMAVSGHTYVHSHYAIPALANVFADEIERVRTMGKQSS
ncbi:MAG: glycosyltransferase [Aureliella sp.]